MPRILSQPKKQKAASPIDSARAGCTVEHRDACTRQLSYVAQHSRFYQQRWGHRPGGSAPTSDDLPDLPFTTRADLQSDQIANGPFGSYLAARKESIARVHKTSGSSGQPLLIALSKVDVERSTEVGADCFRAAGAGPGHLIVHCLNYCMWSGGLTDHMALEKTGAGVIPYGVGKTSDLVSVIQNIRPTGIHCTPSYLSVLEARVRDEFEIFPRELGLKLGLFGGEGGVQDPDFRSRIEATWGIRAMDANYGMSEVLSMFGAECEARAGLHFFGGGVLHAELKQPFDDKTSPLHSGGSGELVLTHLHRECQPLVRYRTSDIIEVLSTDRCDCGRETPRFRVLGRVDDMVVIRGINVFPEMIARVLNRRNDQLSGEYRLQVSRLAPITEARIVAEQRNSLVPNELVAQLASELEKVLTIRPAVHLIPPGSFPRSPGKTCRLERVL